jgi:hypothetical protein
MNKPGTSKNSFIKGMDKDSSKFVFNPDKYYDALNMRLLTKRGLSSGALKNESGTRILFKVPDVYPLYELTGIGSDVTINGVLYTLSGTSTTLLECYNEIKGFSGVISSETVGDYKVLWGNDRIIIAGLDSDLIVTTTSFILSNPVIKQESLGLIGWEYVDNYIVAFTTKQSNVSATPTGTIGQIWLIPYDKITSTVEEDYIDSDNYLIPSQTLIYNNVLNFSSKNRIKSPVVFKKDSDTIKIYFTDTYNILRHINLLDPNTLAIKPNNTEMLYDVNLSTPTVDEVLSGGSLESGMVQYAYQLFSKDGPETIFSPATGLYHLTRTSEQGVDSRDYHGTDAGESVTKSVRVTVDNIDTNFEYIRIVSLFYPNKESIPTVRILNNSLIPSSKSVTVVDDGFNYEGTYTYQEYTQIGSKLFSCETISQKDNILFPANTKEITLDLDSIISWDSRAYRWSGGGTPIADITGNKGGTIDTNFHINGQDVEEDADCIQDYDNYWTGGFKYDLSGNLGGEGPNIKYNFVETEIEIDNSGDDGITWVDTDTGNNPSYKNFASPYIRATLAGYTRGEIYRFGIQFYDLKGRPYYTKWIADIRMPEIIEGYDITRYQSSTNTIYGKTLGLTFEIDVSSLKGHISGFEIVRLPRNQVDKTILGMGLVEPPFLNYILGGGSTQLFPPAVVGQGHTSINSEGFISNFGSSYYVKDAFLFESPDVLMGDKISHSSGDKIDVIGIYDNLTNDDSANEWINKFKTIDYGSKSGPRNTLPIDEGVTLQGYAIDVEYTDVITNIGLYTYSPVIKEQWPPSQPRVAGKTTHFIGTVIPDGGINNMWELIQTSLESSQYNTDKPACGLYRRTINNQYGGNTHSDRYNNTYKACGNPQMYKDNDKLFSGATTFNVYGGDTFVDFFELHRVYWIMSQDREPSTDSYMELVSIPVESTINTQLRTEEYYSKTSVANKYLMQEVGGYKSDGAANFAQDFNLFTYNTVYSKSQGEKLFISKPFSFEYQQQRPVRIYNSVEKSLDDISDNWLKYLTDNKIDLNASLGDITALVNFRDRLVFFQEKAFGMVSVNERASTVTDSTGATLVLGKGGILDDYIYISDNIGVLHEQGITNTGSALYFYSILDKELYQYTGESIKPLGKLSGLSSYINKYGSGGLNNENDMLVNNNGIISVYDPRYSRIFFTILSRTPQYTTSGTRSSSAPYDITVNFIPSYVEEGDSITISNGVIANQTTIATINNESSITIRTTINSALTGAISIIYGSKLNQTTFSYNEAYQVFESRFSFIPVLYMKIDSDILSVPKTSPDQCYVHDKGDNGKFYNSVYDSSVTILNNKDTDFNKMFNNFQINSEVLKQGTEVSPAETVSSIRVYNNLQDTGFVPLVAGDNAKYRLDTWRTFCPRNSSDSGRMRSHTAFTTLNFINGLGSTSHNKDLILHSLITYYHINTG